MKVCLTKRRSNVMQNQHRCKCSNQRLSFMSVWKVSTQVCCIGIFRMWCCQTDRYFVYKYTMLARAHENVENTIPSVKHFLNYDNDAGHCRRRLLFRFWIPAVFWGNKLMLLLKNCVECIFLYVSGKFISYLMGVTMTVSILTLTAVGLDRHYVILYPVSSRQHR